MAEPPAATPLGVAAPEQDALLATKLHVPRPQPGFVPRPRLVTALINELAAQPGDGEVLVLDDYHLIDSQPVHRSLMFLLEHLPPGLRLVLASRADPPLPLPLDGQRACSWRACHCGATRMQPGLWRRSAAATVTSWTT